MREMGLVLVDTALSCVVSRNILYLLCIYMYMYMYVAFRSSWSRLLKVLLTSFI